jgi:hypothetical protein
MMEPVWVVFQDNGYEGCSEPRGVYSSEALAKIAASGSSPYATLEIAEMTLDQPLK